MAERRTLGQILLGSGRISEADVESALRHQREHGGYFGEALVTLGLVTQEELEWGLASQFDLPYVFPEADAIDAEAASLVTPEWALAHLTLPIMRTGDALTVIIDSPIKTDPVDELQHRTGLAIELALASPAKIRELIRQVYGRPAAVEEAPDGHAAITVDTLVGQAMAMGARRFGVSVRGRRAIGWYADRGTVRRRHLASGWADELERILSPPPADRLAEGEGSWSGQVEWEGMRHPVEVRVLSAGAGIEYLLQPTPAHPGVEERFPPPTQAILAEVRLLARSGTARFALSTEPPGLAGEILPFLPTLLLEPAWRSVHLVEGGRAAGDEVFTVALPEEGEARTEALARLQAFQFDAVTVELRGELDRRAAGALDLARVGFIAWPRGGDRKRAEQAGVRWELRVDRDPDGRLEWSLIPLN